MNCSWGNGKQRIDLSHWSDDLHDDFVRDAQLCDNIRELYDKYKNKMDFVEMVAKLMQMGMYEYYFRIRLP